MEAIRISGKDLGAIALPDFCPRCFWIKRNAPEGIPYQIFPGIFSSIDSYSKNVVHGWFDRHKKPPVWLNQLGDIIGYLPPPHFSKFNFVEPKTGVNLTGAPDAIFELRDKTLLIGDYKTAKYTKTQDTLLPIYETQLNAYALIAEQIKMGTVSKLALIYTEPVTDKDIANTDEVHSDNGFNMGFSAHILPLELDTSKIFPLLEKTKDIVSNAKPPLGKKDCKECAKLNSIIDLLK
jgi:hypothetical protein